MTIDSPKPHHIPALRALWQQAFGDTGAFLDSFFSCAFSPSRSLCITAGDTVAAALYWFDCLWDGKRLAYLYAVATEQSLQGQGLCRGLMEDTHAHLQARGYDGCILVPGSSALFGMYEKMGYATCSYIREFECEAAAVPIPLRRLDEVEYAACRRAYLPAGGVIQEQETLSFLAEQSRFYAGENCLLVCAPDREKLIVSELLGDADAASGALAALGYAQGMIRAPGRQKPFAMFHSLTDDPTAPSYFGLAMD